MARARSNISCTVVTTEVLVRAMREVFTGSFSENQFKNLRIVPQFPMSKDKYPCIVVEPDISVIRNAGVGHREYFRDPNDMVRLWQHRIFSGSLNITVMGLSILDRDVLADKIIELLSFGEIMEELYPFFYYIWGDPDAPSGLLSRYQLELNLDEINVGSPSVTPTPWESEDELLYSKTISLEMMGGFYNALRDIPLDYIRRIDFYALLYGDIDPQEVNWVSDLIYADTSTITGIGEVEGA